MIRLADKSAEMGRPETIREQILSEAIDATTKVRESAYGPPGEHFKLVAQFWSVLFGIEVKAHQVPLALDLLKTGRLMHDPAHRDGWVDKAGYAGCGAEVALKEATADDD